MIQILEIGLVAFALFFAQQLLYKKIWNRNLSADISFTSDHIFEGEKGYLKEVIENGKRLPISMLKVKFQTNRNLIFDASKGSRTTDQYYRNDIFHVAGGEKITRTIPFVGGKRGYYSITEMELVASDLFLSVEMPQTYPIRKSLYVYPKPFDNREFRQSIQQLNGEVLTKRHLLEDPFEYRGIREYQPFDDMRSINWKATAKTGDLKVNQRNYTALPSVRIFFNIEDNGVLKKEECVEATLQMAAGLCQYFLSQGIWVSCFGNGVDILTGETTSIAASAGSGQMEQIYRTLARVDTTKPAADFVGCFKEELLERTNGSTMTFLISPNQYEPFVHLIEQLQEAGKSYHWFYPVWDYTAPRLPAGLEKHIQLVHLRK
ncbi:MAG: DUF58 domain-containing protein [Lachnospiraceae bacterium]|nr:DUF58 domain-containing protein [Lachnospiraceae bacterium]